MTTMHDTQQPIDPDVARIVDYLHRELPPDEMQAVEDRLVNDNAFFDLALPLVQAHHALLKWGEEARVTARTEPVLVSHAAPAPIAARAPRHFRFSWPVAIGAAMAASTLFVLKLTLNPELIQTVGVKGQRDAFTGAIATTTTAKDFAIPDGSRIHLDAHGSATYDARMTKHRLILSLTGSATINVPAGQDTVMIARNGGFVKLAANGSYVVKATAGDPMIRVAVLKGGAVMTGSVHDVSLTLAAGEMGQMSAAPQYVGMVPDSMKRRAGGGG